MDPALCGPETEGADAVVVLRRPSTTTTPIDKAAQKPAPIIIAGAIAGREQRLRLGRRLFCDPALEGFESGEIGSDGLDLGNPSCCGLPFVDRQKRLGFSPKVRYLLLSARNLQVPLTRLTP